MSKNPKPTPEELRFVYNLILKGYNDTDILNEYVHLYEQSQLQFPLREDKRFTKDRRKELEAASEVLQEYVKKRVDPVIAKRREEHFTHLADIANSLLVGDLGKLLPDSSTDKVADTYTVYGDEEEEISKEELASRLDGNIENAIHHYGPSDFLDSFVPHLEAECPEIKPGKLDEAVRDNPYILVDTIRILSQRKTFKGTCPICKDW